MYGKKTTRILTGVLLAALVGLSSCTYSESLPYDGYGQTADPETEPGSEPAGGPRMIYDGDFPPNEWGTPIGPESVQDGQSVRALMEEELAKLDVPSGAYVSSKGVYAAGNPMPSTVDYETFPVYFPVVFQGEFVGRIILRWTEDKRIEITSDTHPTFFVPWDPETPEHYSHSYDEEAGRLMDILETHRETKFTVVAARSIVLISDQNEFFDYVLNPEEERIIRNADNLFANWHTEHTVISYEDVDPDLAWLIKP